jgi:hypothetical protein
MKTFALSNQETLVNLTMWGEAITQVQINHAYDFTNLSVSNFNDIKHLQSSPTTTINEIDPITTPCMDMPQQGHFPEIKDATCDSVQCELTLLCISCKKPISPPNNCVSFPCDLCCMRQRLTSVIKQTKLSSTSQQYRVTAYNPILTDFLEAQ